MVDRIQPHTHHRCVMSLLAYEAWGVAKRQGVVGLVSHPLGLGPRTGGIQTWLGGRCKTNGIVAGLLIPFLIHMQA
jgi:hypothetical protein